MTFFNYQCCKLWSGNFEQFFELLYSECFNLKEGKFTSEVESACTENQFSEMTQFL